MKPCWLFAGALLSLPLLAATPEPLYQLQWDSQGLTVQVQSQGCTQPEDLQWQRRTGAKGEWQLTLLRRHADRCKRRPFLLSVHRSWSELGMQGEWQTQPLQILNPLRIANDYLLSAPAGGLPAFKPKTQ